MKTYRLMCKKNTNNINSKIVKTKNITVMFDVTMFYL